MKIQAIVTALALTSCLAAPAFAQNGQPAPTADCNRQAGDRKGDDRKAFIRNCMSTKPAAALTPSSQQDRMKLCNSQAGEKKGDDRKAFMKACLSGKT
ncbi:PsiF family protein [Paraburkholderia sabiae]|uniref:PsiF family protein n=1 Tax=Paraburkholderia sabiae TaxID=273251 RepID=A0ABU9QMI7_9BURK|nr:PsiF family protein [Paraburkholderia sabiae]WJZ77298.1 PsiF family protein [Paraburkholderia sabiae]CAD6548064.1 Phosphate starvation-inducible protein PsiF [Paraburkholderia sabiae]